MSKNGYFRKTNRVPKKDRKSKVGLRFGERQFKSVYSERIVLCARLMVTKARALNSVGDKYYELFPDRKPKRLPYSPGPKMIEVGSYRDSNNNWVKDYAYDL